MINRQNQVTLILGLVTSIVGGILLGLGSWLISQSVSAVAVAVVGWLLFAGAVGWIFGQRYLAATARRIVFRAPLSSPEAQRRIDAAQKEIWSLQISGGEFTAHSPDAYKEWLTEDKNRFLKIAFADPGDTELLKHIVNLSGVASLSNENHAYEHLQTMIETALDRYIELSKELPGQVDVRVYNFSPPFSVHAVDTDFEDLPRRSLFVELYLPDLPARERPALLLRKDHDKFTLYRDKSRSWFNAAVPAGEDSGPAPEPTGHDRGSDST